MGLHYVIITGIKGSVSAFFSAGEELSLFVLKKSQQKVH